MRESEFPRTAPFREILLRGEVGIHAEDGTMTDYCLAWPSENGTWGVLTGHYDLTDAESDPEHFIPVDVLHQMLAPNDFHTVKDLKVQLGDDWKDALTSAIAHAQRDSRFEVPNTYRDRDAALAAISRFATMNGLFPADLKQTLAGRMQDMETAYRREHPKEITAVSIPVGELPKRMTLRADENGSFLKALQTVVGGNIEAFDVLTEDGMCLYVNDEGLFTRPANRAIYATEEMEETGYLSQIDYASPVRVGELYTILHGNIVAVGTDMETGGDISLTDDQILRVTDYFTMVSDPESGEFCRTCIPFHIYPKAPALPGASPLERSYAERNHIVAVGVGYSFALVRESELTGIGVKGTRVTVTVDGKDYQLLKGVTYADSHAIDRLLDAHDEIRIRDFKARTDREPDAYGLADESYGTKVARNQMEKENPTELAPEHETETSHGDFD